MLRSILKVFGLPKKAGSEEGSKGNSGPAARREKLKALIEDAVDPIKVNVGSAGDEYPGWIGSDKAEFDILSSDDWSFFFLSNSISFILAEHVFEHLTERQIVKALSSAQKFLRTGGSWRVAVPDGFFPDDEYINYVRPGGSGAGSDDHKVLLNFRSFSALVEEAGLSPRFVEYWDEAGQFHKTDWSWEDGPVRRSAKHDPRNSEGSLKYTSLIVDCVKEGT